MSINNNWLLQKFDFTAKALVWQDNPITGLREPVYYDETDFNSFVDTALGNDSTGNGTAALPWKSLGKVKASGASYWGVGKKIALRGFVTEYLEINTGIEIYGFGGGICGRAVFGGNCKITYTGTSPVKILNIHWKRISTTTQATGATLNWYCYNVLFENYYFYADTTTTTYNLYWYYCIGYTGYSATSSSSYSCYINIMGNNNTFYNITMYGSYYYVYGDNNHFNNTLTITTKAGFNNKYNVNGNYLDVANYNFNFLDTSPLYHAGTYNPDTDNNNHVGAGTIGVNLTAADDCLNDDVDAVYTNCDKSSGQIYRVDVDDDGIIESGIYDFGEVITRVIMNLNYTYEFNDGVLYRRIQETDGRTVTEIFDCIIRYGEIEADIADCPDLLIEYGKLITVSGTGANRKGNADASFDPTDMIAIDSLLIRHIKWWLKLKTVV